MASKAKSRAAPPPTAASPGPSTKQQPHPPPPSCPNNALCAVCFDNDDGVGDDPIVACDGCGLSVHTQCYGSAYVQPGKAGRPAKLTCALCAAGLKATPPCLLCGDANPGNRAMKTTAEEEDADNMAPLPRKGTGAGGGIGGAKGAGVHASTGWAHLTCVLYIQGPYLYHDGEDRRDGVAGIADVDRKRWELRCALCDARGLLAPKGMKARAGTGVPSGLRSLIDAIPGATVNGAPMQCCTASCSLPFHPLCAREAGWMMTADETGPEVDRSVRLRGYCGSHSSDAHLRAQAVYEAACGLCGSSGREDESLLCDDCDGAFHMHCLSPPLSSVPEGEWFCDGCARRRAVLGTVVALPAVRGGRRGGKGGAGRGPRGGSAAAYVASRGGAAAQRLVPLSEALDALDRAPALRGAFDSDDDDDEDEGGASGGGFIGTATSRNRRLLFPGEEGNGGGGGDNDTEGDEDEDNDEEGARSGGASAVAIKGGRRGKGAAISTATTASSSSSGRKRGRTSSSAVAAPSSFAPGAAKSSGVPSSTAASAANAWGRSGVLTLTDANAALTGVPLKHALPAAALLRSHVRCFPTWGAYVRAGFSLRLYGFGYKGGLAGEWVGGREGGKEGGRAREVTAVFATRLQYVLVFRSWTWLSCGTLGWCVCIHCFVWHS